MPHNLVKYIEFLSQIYPICRCSFPDTGFQTVLGNKRDVTIDEKYETEFLFFL